MEAAKDCLSFWENEAERLNDDRGLLTVINEKVGYYRRAGDKQKALEAVNKSLRIIEKLGIDNSLSTANIYINCATAMSAFGKTDEAMEYYDRAISSYVVNEETETYEYASLLNNMASALYKQKRYEEAEKNWYDAIEILKVLGYHDGEIAISLLMLAHLTFDRDDTAYDKVERLLDEAWEYINSDNQPKDSSYASVLDKCAPSFDYFQRPLEAKALREVVADIYGGDQ